MTTLDPHATPRPTASDGQANDGQANDGRCPKATAGRAGP